MRPARTLLTTLACTLALLLETSCHDEIVEPAEVTAPPGLTMAPTSALTSSLSTGVAFTFTSIPGMDRAYGINDAGLIVGDHGGNNVAAVWTASGGLTTVGRLDGGSDCCSTLSDVNAGGEATGYSHTNVGVSAVRWSRSLGSSDLHVTGRATGQGINDAGDIVGVTFELGSPFRAFYRPSSGTFVQLQSPAGAASEFAYDINNLGNIVGESDIPGNGGGHALV